jgi:hypothetical protein
MGYYGRSMFGRVSQKPFWGYSSHVPTGINDYRNLAKTKSKDL